MAAQDAEWGGAEEEPQPQGDVDKGVPAWGLTEMGMTQQRGKLGVARRSLEGVWIRVCLHGVGLWYGGLSHLDDYGIRMTQQDGQ